VWITVPVLHLKGRCDLLWHPDYNEWCCSIRSSGGDERMRCRDVWDDVLLDGVSDSVIRAEMEGRGCNYQCDTSMVK